MKPAKIAIANLVFYPKTYNNPNCEAKYPQGFYDQMSAAGDKTKPVGNFGLMRMRNRRCVNICSTTCLVFLQVIDRFEKQSG